MRGSSLCPKCGAKTCYRIDPVTLPGPHPHPMFEEFGLTGVDEQTGKGSVLGLIASREAVGAKSLVCASCGYAEVYVADLRLLERTRHEPGAGVTLVDRSKP